MDEQVMDLLCNGDAYHADTSRDSHSSLQMFRSSVPLYEAVRIKKTIRPEPTPQMVFGQLFHAYVLEPDVFMETHVVAPSGIDRRTKAGKEDWLAFQEQAKGKAIVDQYDLSLIRAMAEGIRRNDWARRAMDADGDYEKVLTWDCPETGLPLKMRADKITSDGLIIDLKTTTDVSPAWFAKAVANFGYHRQAALYLDGAWKAAQVEGPFVFVAVSKDPPHECTVCVLDDSALMLGREQNLGTLAELADRKIRGDWSGRWSGDLQVISLPPWVQK